MFRGKGRLIQENYKRWRGKLMTGISAITGITVISAVTGISAITAHTDEHLTYFPEDSSSSFHISAKSNFAALENLISFTFQERKKWAVLRCLSKKSCMI